MPLTLPLPSDPDLIHTWTLANLSSRLDEGDRARASITADGWPEERRYRREMIGKVLVPQWPKPEPHVTITGTISRTDPRTGARWTIHKLRFQSLPDYWVTALLYVPDMGKSSCPGMIVASGHLLEAKAASEYHGISEELVRQGMVVLAFDPVSQGERVQAWDYLENRFLAGWGTTQHDIDGHRALLCGWPLAQAFVWDGQRALDVLLSRPEVDSSRVGVCGISGGGTQTSWLLAADDRFTAASPACFITGWREQFSARVGADPEQYPFPANSWGWDEADMLLTFAPKPLLLVCVTRDFFPIEGTRETHRKLHRAYTAMGKPGNVGLFEADFDHSYYPPLREATVRWFCGLFGVEYDRQGAAEDTCTPQQLQVTPAGQLVTSGFTRTLRDWTVETKPTPVGARMRGPAIYQPGVWQARRRVLLLELLGIPDGAQSPTADKVGETLSGEHVIEQWMLCPEDGMVTPCALAHPVGDPRGVVVYVHESGAEVGWKLPGGPLEDLLRDGWAVLSLDPRGVGTGICRTQGDFYPDYHGRFGVESHISWTWTMMGRSFFGQRVFDVLQALAWARKRRDLSGKPSAVIGVGAGAHWALFSAALDTLVDRVISHAPLYRFESLLTAHDHSWHVSTIPPALLTWGDMAQVAALVAPRELTLLSPVGPDRAAIPHATLKRAFKATQAAFDAQGAGVRFHVVAADDCAKCRRPDYAGWLRE
jgi:dienelactone hydrolase